MCMKYNRPFSEPVVTDQLCHYGCNKIASYKFRNNKLCCSQHYNSCSGKIKVFSDLDHTSRTAKSLETRTRLGITKTSQIKGSKTRIENGHYDRLAVKMQEHWTDHPWQNNTQCPLLPYKTSKINFQGTYEYEFLEMLERIHGLDWVCENVARGPSIWYNDPVTKTQRLYISDFIIAGTIYEIKSSWTWNKSGKDLDLEKKNKAKLAAAKSQGYKIILILDNKEVNEGIMD